MPFPRTAEARLHYEVEGCADGPWLILSTSVAVTLDMSAATKSRCSRSHAR
jgi:hypothetical protein